MAACIAARVDEGCIRATFSATGKGVLSAVSVILVPVLSELCRAKPDGICNGRRAQQYKELTRRHINTAYRAITSSRVHVSSRLCVESRLRCQRFFEPPFLLAPLLAPPFLLEPFFAPPFEALPPFLPPFFAGPLFSFLPRPEPLFLPPPEALLTVAHARCSASSPETPRSS